MYIDYNFYAYHTILTGNCHFLYGKFNSKKPVLSKRWSELKD